MALDIITIPCLSDNYAFLLHDAPSGQTALVDAPEAEPIRQELRNRGWRLSHILLTHHHWDHVEAVEPLRQEFGAKVVGAAADAHRLPDLDLAVQAGDEIQIGNHSGKVIAVPGHTTGHIAYHFPDSAALFSADSLMALGCGRLFEGSAEQMWHSLQQMMALPPQTMVYSGHEYTADNSGFAYTIEPNNPALRRRIRQIVKARARGQATVPSQLAEEIATNPFLRPDSREIRAHLGLENASDLDVFTEIRHRKDNFKSIGAPDLGPDPDEDTEI